MPAPKTEHIVILVVMGTLRMISGIPSPFTANHGLGPAPASTIQTFCPGDEIIYKLWQRQWEQQVMVTAMGITT
jgi:hypothetical protein